MAPSKHALLGPSSSARWLACPPSARLTEFMPNETSVYAEEGTKAHYLCEQVVLAGRDCRRPQCKTSGTATITPRR